MVKNTHIIISYCNGQCQYERFTKIIVERCAIFTVLQISKEESIILRERVKGVVISRTMKQKSSRGKYFVEPTRNVLRVLKELRSVDYIEV